MRVYIYSPVRLFGEGLAASLNQIELIQAAEADCSLARLCDRIRNFDADVLLYDVGRMRRMAAAQKLAVDCPEVPIVALALTEAADEVITCADAGLVGYVPRDASLEELINIMQLALRGEMDCSPSITGSLIRELRRRQQVGQIDEFIGTLTVRERQILGLLSEGNSNKAIALRLNLSVATVKNHVHNVLNKLHLRRRTEAAQLVHQKPWLLDSA